MPITAAKHHLERIAHWQAETGNSGAPPVVFDKTLSNWIQHCRTIGRRGLLNREVTDAFKALGIAIERGPTNAIAENAKSYVGPRGFIPVLRNAVASMREHRVVPTLRSGNADVRHQAAWLVRLQSGILPANSFGWTAPIEDQMIPEVALDLAMQLQSDRGMVAEWVLWCARAQCALDREVPGNNWQETTYVCSHNLLERRYPDLVSLSDRLRRGDAVLRTEIPDPTQFKDTLSNHVSEVRRKVKKVQFHRASIYGCPLLKAIQAVTQL
jgi:hypothetical protein